MTRRFAAALQHSWYAQRPWRWLVPLSGLYGLVVRVRRVAYRCGWLKSRHPGVPVLVVGDITVGGSGKTPLALELIARLGARGRRVGVVSRGYGGDAARYPLPVTADTLAGEAGDEPVLLARRSTAAVAVDPRRVRGARWLVEQAGVDFVIADDGLQHYALARDGEIVVVDARHGLGNRALLPAGPLREPRGRLASVDLVLVHGADRDFYMLPGPPRRLDSQGRDHATLAAFAGKTVHAVAGIGHPVRFFDMLRAFDIDVIEHPMPDHHVYSAAELEFDDRRPVLMTEKDAVKCHAWATPRHWVVPVGLRLTPACAAQIDTLLDRLCDLPATGRAGRA